MSSEHEKDKLKIVVLGDGGIGKSCLTRQFCDGYFMEEFDPSEYYDDRKTLTIDGKSVLLDILDTAGQEEYSAMRDQYMRTGDAFLVVYDVTKRSTFDDTHGFVEQIVRVRDLDGIPCVKMVLCGNKIDLVTERQVSTEEGKSLAEDYGCPFIETSAKTAENVEEAFRMTACRYFFSPNKNDNADGSDHKTKCIIC